MTGLPGSQLNWLEIRYTMMSTLTLCSQYSLQLIVCFMHKTDYVVFLFSLFFSYSVGRNVHLVLKMQ